MPLARVSDKFLAFIDDYRKKHNVSREEATDAILKILEQPQPITSDVPMGMPQNPEKQKAIEQFKQEQECYEKVKEIDPSFKPSSE